MNKNLEGYKLGIFTGKKIDDLYELDLKERTYTIEELSNLEEFDELNLVRSFVLDYPKQLEKIVVLFETQLDKVLEEEDETLDKYEDPFVMGLSFTEHNNRLYVIRVSDNFCTREKSILLLPKEMEEDIKKSFSMISDADFKDFTSEKNRKHLN